MSHLAKLNLQHFTPSTKLSVHERRHRKPLGAIEEQLSVVDAAISGERYSVSVPKWTTDTNGFRTAVALQRVVRAWFAAQDGGYYLQCRYANMALEFGNDTNAVFVAALPDVKVALQTLYAAVVEGELDAELGRVAAMRSKRM